MGSLIARTVLATQCTPKNINRGVMANWACGVSPGAGDPVFEMGEMGARSQDEAQEGHCREHG